MIDHNHPILTENNQETWAIEPNGYSNNQEEFRAFLGRLAPDASAFRMDHHHVAPPEVSYQLMGRVGEAPQTFKIRKQ